MADAPHDLDQFALAALLQSLPAEAELGAALADGRVAIRLNGIDSLMVQVVDLRLFDPIYVVDLAVSAVGAAIGITDTLTGLESTPEAAILNALNQWQRFIFPPIQAAFALNDAVKPPVGITQLVIQPEVQWRIFSGSVMILGQPNDFALMTHALSEKALFPTISGDLLAERLKQTEPTSHWLKLVLTSADGDVTSACQFDGEAWAELGALLTSEFIFPPHTGRVLSVKQMIVMLPA